MHKKQKSIAIAAILFAGLLVFAFDAVTSDYEYPIATICGVPTISTVEFVPTKLSVDQILADDSNLYILFGEHKGIIQVFDTNGTYQYTASFYDHMNGAFSMAVYEGALYVRDSVHNIYILRNGVLIDFINREEVPEWIDMLDFTASAENYQVRFGSVWYIANGAQHCVIQRPIYAALYQNDRIFLLSIIFVLMIGVWKWMQSHSSVLQKE